VRLATQEAGQRCNMLKAENRAAIQLAETKASTAVRASAIQCRNEIPTAENKAAREAKLRQIRYVESQRKMMTSKTNQDVQPTLDRFPKSVNNSPMWGPTCLYDAGLFLHHDASREPSSIEKIAIDSPVSLEFSDSRGDEQTRMRRSQTTGRTIDAWGPSSPTSRYPTYDNDDERLALRRIRREDRIIFARITGETRHDDNDDYDKAKVEPGARDLVRQALARRDPIRPDDAETQKLRDRVGDMVRQALANNGRYDTATETVTVPTRSFAQAVGTPSESWTRRDIKKEKTTSDSSGGQRGSSKDRISPSGERRQDNRDPNRRKTHDKPPPNNDDDGHGDDDDPRRGKNDSERDVEKEDRKPRKGHPDGGGGGGGDEPDQPPDDDPKRGRNNPKKDEKEDREPIKGHPGGGGGGGGDDPSSDSETVDDGFLPGRNRARTGVPRGTQPGDSETSCASSYRRKQEHAMMKLLALPKLSRELADFQYNVEANVMLSSGRYLRRIEWVIATLHAKHSKDLQRVPRKLISLDTKLSVACVIACSVAQRNPLIGTLRQACRDLCANGSDVANGRQSLWFIYKYFASRNTGDVDQGLSVTYSVLDLTYIKLQGGNEGLEKYWNTWAKTISNIADGGGRRSVFEHLFVDEMREAPLVEAYVLEYDEADPGAEKHTWGWLLKTGQASFQRKRGRRNLQQQRKAFRGIPQAGGRKAVAFDDAAPAYETTPKGGGRESREEDQPNVQQPTTPKQQPALADVTKKAIAGECWFFARGSCAEKKCQRDRIMMTDAEMKEAPDSFWTNGRKGASSGQCSDSEGNARARGKGAENRCEGDGKG
jgi:hypothetical protein